MSSEGKKQKEILIRREGAVSYDNDNLYRNDVEIPKMIDDTRCVEDRVKAEKQVFYDAFFRQPFKHIVILAAAGTSLDNGSNKGKTRDGLWGDCRDVIKRLYKELLPCDAKLKRIARDKDIESLLSHVLLVEKVDEAKASCLKPLREQLEKNHKRGMSIEIRYQGPTPDFSR